MRTVGKKKINGKQVKTETASFGALLLEDPNQLPIVLL
jgi:hypothetical protein